MKFKALEKKQKSSYMMEYEIKNKYMNKIIKKIIYTKN